ncbi:hypothetical protein BgiMline_005808 [Biomphalaria glabrata]|nr:hypothetical protein BgiMline_003812 [Biomphalaria glabrata]
MDKPAIYAYLAVLTFFFTLQHLGCRQNKFHWSISKTSMEKLTNQVMECKAVVCNNLNIQTWFLIIVSVDCKFTAATQSIPGTKFVCQQSCLPQDAISDVFLSMVKLLLMLIWTDCNITETGS